MSSFKNRNKLADDNEFRSSGNNTKTNYTILDGTDLADIFVQGAKSISTNNFNNNTTRQFISGITTTKENNIIKVNYTTDTNSFPNCITDGNGKANCDYCNKGHCDYCNHVNCPTNGGHCTYCTYCSNCGNCNCQCQCHCHCQCQCQCNCPEQCDCSYDCYDCSRCSRCNCTQPCGSDGCG